MKKMGFPALIALILGHVIGMIDLVALPVWVGALVQRYAFSPQGAGGLATLFLIGATIASITVAPRFTQLNQRLTATIGFSIAAAAFFISVNQSSYSVLLVLHLISGLSVGSALSMVHGTISHSSNPHRLFAMASIALGFFGILFLGGVPQILIAFGGSALFVVFGVLMAVAAISSATLFRNPGEDLKQVELKPFGKAVWMIILGVSFMAFNQSMVFSFVEVIGGERGFSQSQVQGVLIALGIINFLLPAPLAAWLQNRLNAHRVTQIGPIFQGLVALIVTMATAIQFWAPATAIYVAVMIFTHTFAFGLLAKLDQTGRAASATPAMAMFGAAMGPFVGGALGQNFGYGALGIAAIGMAAIACGLFTKAKSITDQP